MRVFIVSHTVRLIGASWSQRPRRQRRTPAAPPTTASLPAAASPQLLYAVSEAPGHCYPGHPERPERVPAILDALAKASLTAACRPGQIEELADFPPAALDDALAVHPERYIMALQTWCDRSAASGVEVEVERGGSTYLTGSSYLAAFLAVGAAVALIDAVVAASQQHEAAGSGSAPAGFALCRPPGHHCMPGGPMGFCLLANAAIAARYAQRRHGLQRVAIADFDVHHGNGTQTIFESDPNVLFISSHENNGYPFSGSLNEAGLGAARGTIINLPMPGNAGHEAELAAFDSVVLPAVRRFKPDMILVSAGYDAHWQDPLGGLQFTGATYHALGGRLKGLADEVCGGRLVFLLEGGYALEALGQSVANTFLGVLGEPPLADDLDPALLDDEPMEEVQRMLLEARRIHRLP